MTQFEKHFDVAIAGAGPAGSTAAIVLGRKGHSVALFDKKSFPRDKTCGDGITYKIMEDLGKLGVLEEIERLKPFKIRGYSLFFMDGSKLSVEYPADGQYPIFIMSRNQFDNVLLNKALSYPSVQFFPATEVKQLLDDHQGVKCKNNHEYQAKTILDATGYTSILGKHNRDTSKTALAIRGYYEGMTGLSENVEIYFTDSVLPGYFWIFPTSETSANVGCGTFQSIIDTKKINLKTVMNDFIESHPVARRKFANSNLIGRLEGGKIPLAFGEFGWSRVKDNLITIGDAGGFVNPITAEGISYAIKTGIFAGETISNALGHGDVSEQNLKPFDSLWKEEFSSQYKPGEIYTNAISKDLLQNYFITKFKQSMEQKHLGSVAEIYEYMVKLKVITKLF